MHSSQIKLSPSSLFFILIFVNLKWTKESFKSFKKLFSFIFGRNEYEIIQVFEVFCTEKSWNWLATAVWILKQEPSENFHEYVRVLQNFQVLNEICRPVESLVGIQHLFSLLKITEQQFKASFSRTKLEYLEIFWKVFVQAEEWLMDSVKNCNVMREAEKQQECLKDAYRVYNAGINDDEPLRKRRENPWDN